MARKPLSDKPMQATLRMRMDEDLLNTFESNYDAQRRRQIIQYAIIKANMEKTNSELEYLNLHEEVNPQLL